MKIQILALSSMCAIALIGCERQGFKTANGVASESSSLSSSDVDVQSLRFMHNSGGSLVLAPPQTLNMNQCSQPVVVAAVNSTGQTATLKETVTVNLTASSSTTLFYSDIACTTTITQLPLNTTTSTGTFYLMSSTAGSVEISASAHKFVSAVQIETILTPTPGPEPTPTPFADPFTPKRTLTVCASGCNHTLPSQALAVAQDYDLIQIQGGDYVDCFFVAVPHLWIQGVGGTMPRLHDKVCGSKGIIVVDGTQLTVDNLDFSNMSISSSLGGNAAGIRWQNGDLDIRNCYFHDGQNGILGGNHTTDKITITNSHFARLGYSGYEHDMYINHVASFTLKNSLVEQANLGHEVKTRAHKSVIECNTIIGGYDSAYQDSYNINLPNGGEAHILYNLIGQGPYQQNSAMVDFGSEGLTNPVQSLEMVGNILVNDLGSGTFLQLLAAPTSPATLTNNWFIGAGTVVGGAAASSATQTGSGIFSTRAAAGITTQYPMPSYCTAPIGNLPFD